MNYTTFSESLASYLEIINYLGTLMRLKPPDMFVS